MALLIGNELFVPGQSLSFRQMSAVQLALTLGQPVNAEVLAQYNAQGGQNWIRENLANNTVIPPPPPATTAETVQDDAPKGPTAPPAQTVGTDGRIVPPAETGTDAALKTTETTQAITTNSNSGQATPAPGTEDITAAPSGTATLSPGVAAAGDDGVPLAAPQQAVDAGATAEPNVKPRPNVLDQYSSYTYSASVYLMTEVQYTRLLTSRTKSIDGYQLLFQSGGAANNVGGVRPLPSDGLSSGGGRGIDGQDGDGTAPAAAPPDGGRNPFFDNDFYIDSIAIENLPPGKGTGAAHNVTSLKFTVVEPNGITLIDRLRDAVANSAPQDPSGKVNYSVATYLMVIRFYGYDSDGNIEQVRNKTDQEGTSDAVSVVEKFIPFRIDQIKWSVGSKLVSYEWVCVPVGQRIAAYASRGTIPYDVQLVDSTVGGLLGGDVKYSNVAASAANPGASTAATSTDARQRRSQGRLAASQASAGAPAKANAAPTDKKTITRGLVGAMNQFQQQLVKDGVFTYADEYVVQFIGPAANKIRDAKLQLPNAKVEKKATAAGQATTQDAQMLDQSKTSVDMLSRSFSITAGQQLLQAIELTIRNSSYIYNQALVIINPDGTQIPNPNSRNQPLKWFVITMTAEAISDLDPKRNDRAYRITYSIAAREVKNVNNKYFPVSKFSGVHKSYPYWFTGQNTAVLDYQETMNHLYQLTVSGSDTESSLAAKIRQNQTSSMSEIVTYNYAPRSTESSSGASGKQNELAANLAEVLYSPTDLATSKIKIVGDPAWIMQGTNFRESTDEIFSGESLSSGFLPDGSIAFDNQDVLYEIRWQRPEDYDLNSGLADPYSQTQKKYNNRTALQSRVYLCRGVVSEFNKGKFEQTLDGVLYEFPTPSRTNTANPAAANKAITKSGEAADSSADRATAGAPGLLDPQQRAAILGAQQNMRPAPVSGELGSGTFATPSGTGPSEQLGSGTFTVQNAPPPGAPTSGTGGAVANVPASVQAGPRKLPASGTAPGQIAAQVVANQRLRDRTSAASGSPESSNIPTRQPQARET